MIKNLFLRSTIIMSLLFGLLFAVMMFFATIFDWGTPIVLAFTLGIVFLQYLLSPYIIDWIYRIVWTNPASVSSSLDSFIKESCRKYNIPVPRFGVIKDGNPNAFTYGHYKRDARLILTSGLIDVLDEDEIKAVVGHELGHIAHNDFIVMTIATAIPLVLFILARSMFMGARATGSGREKGNTALFAFAVAVVSYAVYIISNYIALLLSRVREYYADSFSAELTGQPDSLSSALVKIAYGLTRAGGRNEKRDDIKNRAIGALGIFDAKSAKALAFSAASKGSYTPDEIENAMYWDLWNPWGLFMELQSTHPLPAKRIRSLSAIAQKLGKVSKYKFKLQKPESYWDEFFVDLFVRYSPYLMPFVFALVAVLALNPIFALPALILGYGLFNLIKTLFKYRGNFKEKRVKELVSNIKASPVRGIPAVIKGRIIGRGIPGLMWSEDLVIQDQSGYIMLDYNQPLFGFLNFLFGLFRAGSYVGQQAEIKGWFRRSPVPYIEVKEIRTADGSTSRVYQYHWNLFISLAALILGWVLSAGAFALL